MERLGQNKLLHDAVRFMVVDLQGLKASISLLMSIETNRFYWLDDTKLLTPIKIMERLGQNKLLHDAVRFMVVDLQGLKAGANEKTSL